MREALIVGGVRTPFVKAGGELAEMPVQDLGQRAVQELLFRFDVQPEEIDELICGNVSMPADAANLGRVIALRAGIPLDRIAHTVSRNCASGFEAITQAVERIQAGHARCIIAVGAESMSNIPLLYSKNYTRKVLALSKARSGWQRMRAATKFRLSDLKPVIGIQEGLTDPVSGMIMGNTAEKLAREYNISRIEQDEYALRSHQRAAAAWEAHRLSSETMIYYPENSDKPILQDIGPRAGQSLPALARLRPYFDRRWGTVTVGNSCQVTDGAVAMLVAEESWMREHGLAPLGRIRSYAYAGCDPSRMGLGPVYASAKALKDANLTLQDMELIELNEAFAAQVLACLKAFKNPPRDCTVCEEPESVLGPVDENKLNVNGGAIALGHPVGATGTRLVLTLLHELARRQQKIGLATLCVGGGQGGALILERVGDI